MSVSYEDLAIVVENVAVGYGGRAVQSGISAEIAAREIFAIVGDSGSGKSTLMKSMIGLLRPQSGRILMQGKPIEGPPQGRPPGRLPPRRPWPVTFRLLLRLLPARPAGRRALPPEQLRPPGRRKTCSPAPCGT